jgi:hypothetical protein
MEGALTLVVGLLFAALFLAVVHDFVRHRNRWGWT